jgi:transcriptional regulator with XRE-family HTH domain
VAGLPYGRRRKTPGLRREEVAELAGIGTAWYTWLEQARTIRPSEGALRQIARALQLDETEKKYFLKLALERAPKARHDEVVAPVLLSALAEMRSPAMVMGQRWDRLAHNEAANAVFDLDDQPDRNLLRYMFTPAYRMLVPNWEQMARMRVALFRFQNALLLDDPWITTLVDELKQESPQFRAWWAEQAVTEARSCHTTLEHPFVGRLCFDHTTLIVADSPNLTLGLWICDGSRTRQRVDELIRQRRCGQRSRVHNLWAALDNRERDAASG